MFELISTRIQDAFKSLRREVRMTPDHVEAALREADVNFKVVKAFIDRVRDRAMGPNMNSIEVQEIQVVGEVRCYRFE